eukprot:TRINITY_DN92565_c0_g1_i1.p1 TRINITY_DN92565_c0_g1~~TRINITY_DN92565_c0_g1_i1.p1  ORF type:complete len:359 (-),score=48.25 TRINITY_DN92565_c0_g1_i1:56-1132(-)
MAQPSAALRDLLTQDDGKRVSPTAIVPEPISTTEPIPRRPAWKNFASRLLCCFQGKIRRVQNGEGQNRDIEVELHSGEGDEGVRADVEPRGAEARQHAQAASSESAAPSAAPPAQAALRTPPPPQNPRRPESRPDRPQQLPAQFNGSGQNETIKKAPPETAQREPQPVAKQRVHYLLPPQEERFHGMKTLVLDLDETLVHSSFRKVSCEMELTLELGEERHKVYVKKRPGVDEFIRTVAEHYEVVIFTASTALYANTLLDQLDTTRSITHRLFRDSCSKYKEGYVKDLSKLGRNLNHVTIIDNLPICYALQPENAIPIQTWRDDPDDTELYDLLPILVALAGVDNIPEILSRILHDED